MITLTNYDIKLDSTWIILIQFDNFIKLHTIQIIFGKFIQLFNLCIPEDFFPAFMSYSGLLFITEIC